MDEIFRISFVYPVEATEVHGATSTATATQLDATSNFDQLTLIAPTPAPHHHRAPFYSLRVLACSLTSGSRFFFVDYTGFAVFRSHFGVFKRHNEVLGFCMRGFTRIEIRGLARSRSPEEF